MTDSPKEATLRMLATKSDSEKAVEYRERLGKLFVPVCELLTEAKLKDGLDVGFSITTDAMGRSFVNVLKVTREL